MTLRSCVVAKLLENQAEAANIPIVDAVRTVMNHHEIKLPSEMIQAARYKIFLDVFDELFVEDAELNTATLTIKVT